MSVTLLLKIVTDYVTLELPLNKKMEAPFFKIGQ